MRFGTLRTTVMACVLSLGAGFAVAQATNPAPPAPDAASPAKAKPKAKTALQPRPKVKAQAQAKPRTPAHKQVDYSKLIELNSATKQQLMTLPGVDAAAADRIIAGRPYMSKTNLETHHILPKGSFITMRALIYVVPPVAKAKP